MTSNNLYLIKKLERQTQHVRLSLVVPTYNESENIKDLIVQLTTLLDVRLPGDYELIVVDDNSPDETWKIVQQLQLDCPRLRLIKRDNEKGLSSAVIRGWQISSGKFLGVIDGDLQHPPDTIIKLIEIILQVPDVDLVVASRNVKEGGVDNWSISRRLLSRGAQILGLVLMSEVVGRVSDPMSGYFVVRRDAIAERTLKPMGYKILLEVIAKGDVRNIEEVGYIFKERKRGGSKVGWRVYRDYVLHLMSLRLTQGRNEKE